MDNNFKMQSKDQLGYQQINELSFRDYFILLRLHYVKIALFTIVGSAIAFYNVMTVPPRYTATATIAVRDKPGAGMIMDLTGNRSRNRMSNEIQLIRSRSVAKETIEIIWLLKKNSLALFDT